MVALQSASAMPVFDAPEQRLDVRRYGITPPDGWG
jgi:hypothetical protein